VSNALGKRKSPDTTTEIERRASPLQRLADDSRTTSASPSPPVSSNGTWHTNGDKASAYDVDVYNGVIESHEGLVTAEHVSALHFCSGLALLADGIVAF
jgi:hypothetical protein